MNPSPDTARAGTAPTGAAHSDSHSHVHSGVGSAVGADAGHADVLARRIAREVVSRHLAVPAILFLEMNRPLSFLASQGLWALRPFGQMLGAGQGYDALARALEDRGPTGGIERIVRAIEEEEAARPAR